MEDSTVRLRPLELLVRSEAFLRHLGSMSPGELDAALDLRDVEPFDTSWIAAWNRVSALQPIPKLDDLREFSFRKAFAITSGHDDAAAYVSDDVDLLGRWLIGRLGSDGWVGGLARTYASGHLPCGSLVETEDSLDDALRVVDS